MNKKNKKIIILSICVVIIVCLIILFCLKLVGKTNSNTKKNEEQINFSDIENNKEIEFVISDVKFSNIYIDNEEKILYFDITNESLETIMLNKVNLKLLNDKNESICQSEFSLGMRMPKDRTLEKLSVSLFGDCENAEFVKFELTDYEIINEE